MNYEETHALYAQGKETWNKWAEEMLAQKQALIDDGVGWPDARMKEWSEQAKVYFSSIENPHRFEEVVVVSDFIFPWNAEFEGATFSGDAWFVGTIFHERASFKSAIFSGSAMFEDAIFFRDAWFEKVTFSGSVWFEITIFYLSAWFVDTIFSQHVWFRRVTFYKDVMFQRVIFSRGASFDSAIFSEKAWFENTTFSAGGGFDSAIFSGDAWFLYATFSGIARFDGATFFEFITFNNAVFSGNIVFESVKFLNSSNFSQCNFKNKTIFELASFEKSAVFDNSNFEKSVSFKAIQSKGVFSLANTTFNEAPNFIQAHFEEVPRLDHIKTPEMESIINKISRYSLAFFYWVVTDGREPAVLKIPSFIQRQFEGYYESIKNDDPASLSARYRALKRLAVQGHDHELELDFSAGELKAARYVTDFPHAWIKTDHPIRMSNIIRWYLGYAYEILSDFGRSIILPIGWFSLTLILSAGYYLDATEMMRARDGGHDWFGGVSVYSLTVDPPACYDENMAEKITNSETAFNVPPIRDKPMVSFTGLTKAVRDHTNAAREAWQLAYHNATLFLSTDGEALHRTYGCLYGVERFGDNPIAYVPPAVTLVSGIQKLFSAFFIFLFGLGLRNKLRMK